jgi:hypothetical protein
MRSAAATTHPLPTQPASLSGNEMAERLNRECLDVTVDREALNAALKAGGLDVQALFQSRPHLFSDAFVFVGASHLRDMTRLIEAIEAVIALPEYQRTVLGWAPDIARHDPGYPGLCLGYDFHLATEGVRLIEINTNAGGSLLNARMAQSQAHQRGAWDHHPGACPQIWRDEGNAEAEILAMFQETWNAFGAPRPLKRLAIVDKEPASQYLAPEFELFCRLFTAAGIEAWIADPAEFTWNGQTLRHARGAVDMVYNRLTDFALAAPALEPLRAACLAGAVALTPHPRAHALYADKRNLTLLSDPEWLEQAGVPADLRQILLSGIPRTLRVDAATPEAAEHFWQTRKSWFFKPADGFGSRAAYRGDKLTRRVFGEILASGNYVAQTLSPPSTRRIRAPQEMGRKMGQEREKTLELKLDLRNYVAQGKIHPMLVAARLYQGQTTNFRTPGGGFAVVFEVLGGT